MAARVAQASICDIISSYVARAGTWLGYHMMPGTRQRPERRTFLGAERRRPGIGIGVEPSAVVGSDDDDGVARENSIRAARNEERKSRERLNSLSPRERQILDRVVAGKLNKEIAYELGISERTVKTDRSDIMAKLGAVSIAGLARQTEQLRHALREDKLS